MTAPELRDRLELIFPSFASYWTSPDNLFRHEQGDDAMCGVFAAFSYFVRERFDSIEPKALDDLGQFIEQCLEMRGSELWNDCRACLLENLASYKFTASFTAHLGPRGKAFMAELRGDAV
jgi:hypothetical protein